MLVGVPSEIKKSEHRVGLTPSSVREFVTHGHDVLVETGAGTGINYSDEDYKEAGAQIGVNAAEIFEKADMVIRVKEPQPDECKMLREGQVLFTYLHLAPDPKQAKGLMESGCTAIAYETVTGPDGRGLPLLEPMSAVAGRMSVTEGVHHLQKHKGGNGTLIPGVPGIDPGKVLIIGGGIAGFNAAQMATGLKADVTILEKDEKRANHLQEIFGKQANVQISDEKMIRLYIKDSDLVIGAVLVPGAEAPKLVTRDMLSTMKPGAVMVDIAIDQGGCFETSNPTTHENPTFVIDGIVHYCVANMPGAYARTSAQALNNAVLPYALKLADEGWKKALTEDPNFYNGLNVCKGQITHEAVAEALDLPYVEEPEGLRL